ncbi:MAG: DUF2256 domain-containing protein [Xanthomonadales bacterium]|nr:DUF2256 domain-containing protein [Xanthomonadales bacterium]MCB1642938.1 DUF2256 domain-containing protein [Xanthomonadales bacterium]
MPARESRRPLRPEKTCIVGGRPMQWRKRWAKVWAQVRYCSDACRKGTPRVSGRVSSPFRSKQPCCDPWILRRDLM